MVFESFKRYRAIVSGPGVEINLDTPNVSEEVSYLTNGDVNMQQGGALDERRNFRNDWEKAMWGDRGGYAAEVRPGTEIIVQYMSNSVFHVLASDSPNCFQVVGEASIDNLRDFRDLSAAPKYRPGRKLTQGMASNAN